MEHRCGNRVQLSLTARLILPSRSLAARLENVSLSGAFVVVAERIPEQTRFVVELADPEAGSRSPCRLAAHVVRETANGIGIEWCTFAPWPLLRLLRQRDASIPGNSKAAFSVSSLVL